MICKICGREIILVDTPVARLYLHKLPHDRLTKHKPEPYKFTDYVNAIRTL